LAKKRVYAHIIIDGSGSMSVNRDNTRKAINEYISSLRAEKDVSARLSLSLFRTDSHDQMLLTDLRDNVKVKDPGAELTEKEYEPYGATPLNDAIAKVVHQIDSQTRREGEKVVLVIMTDGEENASKEHSKEAIKALLDNRRNSKDWLVVYLGADHDAFASAAKYGVGYAQTMSFDKMGAGHTHAMRATARNTAAYAATGSVTASAYTDKERENSLKK
jgi:Mg-chelatase subunit ChlD